MKIQGEKAIVIGCGKSGISAASLLAGKGASVILYDSNEDTDISKVKENLQKEAEVCGTGEIKVTLGKLTDEQMNQATLLVISPGVPIDSDLVLQFKNRGIPVIGEIELAYQCGNGTVVAITGTNGKTTTTTLVGEIMKRANASTFVVGNIGNPYAHATLKTSDQSVIVAEISSFQLETVKEFAPHVSAILNITPDHLNRHHTMENYIAVKNEVTKNQTKDDYCILNYENEYTRKLGENCNATVIYFSSERKLANGLYLDGEMICQADDGVVRELMNIHDMSLVGICNIENVMAAIAMTEAMNVPMDIILDTIKKFHAVEHRIEFVATKNGVDYYNDSKGTNPDAAIQGIKAMCKPTVLIGGGYDKQSTYDEWIDSFDQKVKLLVLIGQTRDKIAECAKKHGFEKIVMADTFEEAFEICKKNAKSGDAVLLSPACASWGMFPNYEERGRIFKDMVNKIKE